jgi:hypothetical protein
MLQLVGRKVNGVLVVLQLAGRKSLLSTWTLAAGINK